MTEAQIVSIISGLIALAVIALTLYVMNQAGFKKSRRNAMALVEEAEKKADTIVREAQLKAKTQAYEIKLNAEKEMLVQRTELQDYENRLERRDEQLNIRDKNMIEKDQQILNQQRDLEVKSKRIDTMEKTLSEGINAQVIELERIADMNKEQAKDELFSIVEQQMEHEKYAYIKEKEEEAHERAEVMARNIIALAISRYAQDEVIDRTSTVITLPSEEMKGRIIGREGRNIRAFTQATGVDLIVDDTPEIITLSSFDPIRRQIAHMALNQLISDGRIQPGRIEDVVEKARKELYATIHKLGQDTLFELGVHKVNTEIADILGRLQYRYSYGQNVLQHSIDVAHITGMMAAELGLNQRLARRAGLLHDIGKGLDFEMEGSHVELGARLAKKHNEHAVVINAIESHHGDTEATSAISVLVAAADAISAARPGARFESFENYIQRLEELEALAMVREGVERAFAIQAGRELRVMVVPSEIDDAGTMQLAREIREDIENKLTYPGQIKVHVIRELRATELAK